jgi:hypothetical protein
VLHALVLAAFVVAPVSVHAQLADPAHLSGPDRTARLVAGAKREGGLTLYTSAILEHMTAVTNAANDKISTLGLGPIRVSCLTITAVAAPRPLRAADPRHRG